MADFNISANFNVNPKSRTFAAGTMSISFSAAQACRVTFTPASNCFGVGWIDLAGGNDTTSLTVSSDVATQGTAAAQPTAAAAAVGRGASMVAGNENNPDILDITFDSPV